MLRSPDAATLATRLDAVGFVDIRIFGQFVVARFPLVRHTTTAALSAGARGYRVAKVLSPETLDFGELLSTYRLARAEARSAAGCPAG